MTLQEIIEEIESNFTAIDKHLSRMDLELLPELLERRTALVGRLTQCLQADGVGTDERKRAVERLRDQNFHIQARIMARKDRTARELRSLYNLSRRNASYIGIPKGLKDLKRSL
jgi:hypothetical protein